MKNATILVVDDEPQIRRVLRATLTAEGYSVIEARDGMEALEKIRSTRPDLILLDRNMPVMDGLEACRQIRPSSHVPILMLTVRSAEKDKVHALDAGADDYVVKPFGIQELLARVRALLRRVGEGKESHVMICGDLRFDFEKREILVRGEPVHLTPKEFAVLQELVNAAGRPLSHRRLLQSVWGPDYGEETESLRVVINQLRKKIEANPAKPSYIVTEPWVGYRFTPPAEEKRD